MEKKSKPYFSVIIPAYNEERYIGYAFAGLKQQTFKDFEAIVVYRKGNDRTAQIAGKNARVIIDKGHGVARARNKGAAAARGEILLFLDADTKPKYNLLEEYEKAFRDKELAVATGLILPLEKRKLRIKLGYIFVSVIFVWISIALGRPSVIGSNFAVRKKVFKKSGGFNPGLVTYEDWDLSKRLKKYGKARIFLQARVYTSTRRIDDWGMWGFFKYYVGNIFRYNFLKKPKKDYMPVR